LHAKLGAGIFGFLTSGHLFGASARATQTRIECEQALGKSFGVVKSDVGFIVLSTMSLWNSGYSALILPKG
jgi:hypothetical protein